MLQFSEIFLCILVVIRRDEFKLSAFSVQCVFAALKLLFDTNIRNLYRNLQIKFSLYFRR